MLLFLIMRVTMTMTLVNFNDSLGRPLTYETLQGTCFLRKGLELPSTTSFQALEDYNFLVIYICGFSDRYGAVHK